MRSRAEEDEIGVEIIEEDIIEINDNIDNCNTDEHIHILGDNEGPGGTMTTNIPPQKIHYLKDLEDLRDKCVRYKKAHSDCKSIHFMYDKIIKLSTLGLSTLTTYFISSHDNEDMTPEDLDIDRKLTFITTLVSGINVIFNFSEKMETHKNLNIEYFDLYNDLDETIRLFTETTREHNIKEVFQDYNKTFKALNKRTGDIGVIKYIKQKHGTI